MTPLVLQNLAVPVAGAPVVARGEAGAGALFAAVLAACRGDGAPAIMGQEGTAEGDADPDVAEWVPTGAEAALAAPVVPSVAPAAGRETVEETGAPVAAPDRPAGAVPAKVPVVASVVAPVHSDAGPKVDAPPLTEGEDARARDVAAAPPPVATDRSEVARPALPMSPDIAQPAAEPGRQPRMGDAEAPRTSAEVTGAVPAAPHRPLPVAKPVPQTDRTRLPEAPRQARDPAPITRDIARPPAPAPLAAKVTVHPAPGGEGTETSPKHDPRPVPPPVESRAMAAMQRIAATLRVGDAPALPPLPPVEAAPNAAGPETAEAARPQPAVAGPSFAAPAAAAPAPAVAQAAALAEPPGEPAPERRDMPQPAAPVAGRSQPDRDTFPVATAQDLPDAGARDNAGAAPARAADPVAVERTAEPAPLLAGGEPLRAGPPPVALAAPPVVVSSVPMPAVGPLIVATAVEGTDAQLEITLAPEELGKLSIALRHEGERLLVTVTAERPETLDLVRRNADHLMQELRQAGIGGAALSFGQSGQGGERSPPAATAPGDQPGRDPRPAAAADHAPPQAHRHASGAGLDLRL